MFSIQITKKMFSILDCIVPLVIHYFRKKTYYALAYVYENVSMENTLNASFTWIRRNQADLVWPYVMIVYNLWSTHIRLPVMYFLCQDV
jgi:hypothetical protein